MSASSSDKIPEKETRRDEAANTELKFGKNKPNKNREFLNWIARQRCSGCGSSGVQHDSGEYLVTPSHVKTRGAGGGDEGNVVPHCIRCHEKLGKLGVTLFQQLYKLNLEQLAKAYLRKWLSEQAQS